MFRSKRVLLVSIFFLSIVIQSIFLSFLGPAETRNENTDYKIFYEPVANNILDGKGITISNQLAVRYPPGYPVILSAIFKLSEGTGISRLKSIAIFNVLTTALSCLLIFLIADLIFGQRVAFISALL